MYLTYSVPLFDVSLICTVPVPGINAIFVVTSVVTASAPKFTATKYPGFPFLTLLYAKNPVELFVKNFVSPYKMESEVRSFVNSL